MDAEQIHALADDLRIRERTEELCAALRLSPASHAYEVKRLMQAMLDVALESWLSARASGGEPCQRHSQR